MNLYNYESIFLNEKMMALFIGIGKLAVDICGILFFLLLFLIVLNVLIEEIYCRVRLIINYLKVMKRHK